MASSLAEGAKVWIYISDLWRKAELIRVGEDGSSTVRLTESGEERTVKSSEELPFQNSEESDSGVEDLCRLNYLHVPAILHNVQVRYAKDEVYTYTGRILIAVNPFKWLPIYGDEMIAQYAGKELIDNKPHVFAISDSAYRAMIREKKSQSILVSGESGAGKTETTKLCMQYLAAVSGGGKGTSRIAQQVLESNPILEAFGNAKTLRNNNSSRFGKFIEIQFDKEGHVAGASIQTYLLEKSRVIGQAAGERNYHVFYQLLSGASPEQRERWKLQALEKYIYVNHSGCCAIEGVDDDQDYQRTRQAMGTIGMSEEEIDEVFTIVSAVLNLGQVKFAPHPNKEDAAIVETRDGLSIVADLLRCNMEELQTSLCTKRIFAGGEWYTIDHTVDQAVDARDALAKGLYGRLFEWLVQRINKSIRNDAKTANFIGVLDIFGFESFKINSFEQLCINYANEKLQQQFNQYVFKMEQEEYMREKITWSYVDFVDNQPCLDLLEKKPLGLFCLLDEECVFPKGSDKSFAGKVIKSHTGNKYFDKPRMSSTAFSIKHYAGEVLYETANFLEKNKDALHPDCVAVMQRAPWPFLKGLFPASEFPNDVANSKRSILYVTVGSQFKEQLTSLMQRVAITSLHYIRCIKPNTVNKPDIFEQINVGAQLRYAGVLEAVRVSRAAYPNRLPHVDFIKRFKLLAGKVPESRREVRLACEYVLGQLIPDPDKYQLGVSKVFFRAGQLERLEEMRTEKQAVVVIQIQQIVRSFLARKAYLHKCTAILNLQTAVRKRLARSSYLKFRSCAIKAQSVVRRRISQKRFGLMRRDYHAICIQTYARTLHSRRSFLKLRKAAIVLETVMRQRIQHKRFVKELAVVRRRKQLECLVEDLKKQLEEEVMSRESLEKRLRESEDDRSRAQEDKSQLESKVSQLEEANRSLEGDMKQLHDLNSSLRADLESMRALMSQREMELKEERSALDVKWNEERAQMEEEMRKLKEEGSSVKEASSVSLVSAQQEVVSLRAEIESMRQEIESSRLSSQQQIEFFSREMESVRSNSEQKIRELAQELESARQQRGVNSGPAKVQEVSSNHNSQRATEATTMPDDMSRQELKAVKTQLIDTMQQLLETRESLASARTEVERLRSYDAALKKATITTTANAIAKANKSSEEDMNGKAEDYVVVNEAEEESRLVNRVTELQLENSALKDTQSALLSKMEQLKGISTEVLSAKADLLAEDSNISFMQRFVNAGASVVTQLAGTAVPHTPRGHPSKPSAAVSPVALNGENGQSHQSEEEEYRMVVAMMQSRIDPLERMVEDLKNRLSIAEDRAEKAETAAIASRRKRNARAAPMIPAPSPKEPSETSTIATALMDGMSPPPPTIEGDNSGADDDAEDSEELEGVDEEDDKTQWNRILTRVGSHQSLEPVVGRLQSEKQDLLRELQESREHFEQEKRLRKLKEEELMEHKRLRDEAFNRCSILEQERQKYKDQLRSLRPDLVKEAPVQPMQTPRGSPGSTPERVQEWKVK
mmetsp:Transcript_36306/g.58686  ORF Transcript_36306/g.58686 Transcript_36306/m.58686 type:complete len:1509 (-) Transcript_36306:778-5304(-)